jgi:dTDP-4-amino-4,6-dideoxygalactose transaminase
MNVPLVDLVSQYQELHEELDAAVLKVLSSGRYTPADEVASLENEICSEFRVERAIACNSGTDALKIALQAMDIGPGDEVITTPFTFVATIEAVIQNGAKPIFVDIDRQSFNMNPYLLETAITEKTKAILPIHIFGQIAEMEKIMNIAAPRGIAVLEDAAQAIGSSRNGLKAGAWGRAATLSFFPTKNLGAAGDAGMVITNDQELAERCASLRVHGMAKTPYYYEDIGHTSRMDEIQGAILRVKLKKLKLWNDRRRHFASLYDAILEDSDAEKPYVDAETDYHPYHQYTIRHKKRDALMEHLRSNGVGCAIYYPVPLHVQPPYAYLGNKEGDYPETEQACKEVLSLPIQAHLTPEQVEYAAKLVATF